MFFKKNFWYRGQKFQIYRRNTRPNLDVLLITFAPSLQERGLIPVTSSFFQRRWISLFNFFNLIVFYVVTQLQNKWLYHQITLTYALTCQQLHDWIEMVMDPTTLWLPFSSPRWPIEPVLISNSCLEVIWLRKKKL